MTHEPFEDQIYTTTLQTTKRKKMTDLEKARDKNTPPEELLELACVKDPQIRYAVAENPNATETTLARLFLDEDLWTHVKIAGNPRTPPELLKWLTCWHRDYLVRRAGAGNPNTPPEALSKLNESEPLCVLLKAAENPNTPADSLERFSLNNEWQIRRAVAQNPSTPIDIKNALQR